MFRYCKVHAGRVDPKSWSLALECRNFQDQLTHDILFQERMFVMSRCEEGVFLRWLVGTVP